MKKNKLFLSLRIFLGGCAALGWWGLLYPELTMTPSTYRVVDENGTVLESEEMVEWDFDRDIYREILEAEPEQIRFRSKLYMKWINYRNHENQE